jgi:hypothetical protein
VTRRRAAVVVVAAGVLVVAGIVLALALHRGRATPRLVDGSASAADFDYVIPLGTGRRIDAGDDVEVLPERLVAHVGQSIRVVNDDDRGHVIGPFFVAAGQTLTQTFASPGVLEGRCSVHLSGRFVIEVQP